MPKKPIIISIIVLLVFVFVYQTFIKKSEPEFTLVSVVRGDVAEEVSETGQVQKGDKVNLGFKNAGRLEAIYVKVGQTVGAGQWLAKLETSQLDFEFQKAQSALDIAQANLDKLLAGATAEEIQIAQTKVNNKQIALNVAKQDLEAAYEDALNVLEDAYLQADNAKNTVSSIQIAYFTGGDQESLQVKEKEADIKLAVSEIKSYLDLARADSSHSNVDSALAKTKDNLSTISDNLRAIRETCEVASYRNTVSTTNKTSLDTRRDEINTALTNIVNAQQTISSEDLDINTAQGNLQSAEDELASILASPRAEDKTLYQAKVNEAQAQLKLLEDQIKEATLKSPIAGQVIEIKKRVGETVQPSLQDAVITILPSVALEIKAKIYEEDVVKVEVGDPVDISLVAFPEKVFKGKVISIDPAEKLVEGVVYYDVVLVFEEEPEGVKPGMTADLIIKTALRENVLIIPEDALQTKEGKAVVEVLQGGEVAEREVQLGLTGTNDMVEVLSGLEEGEQLILR